MTLAQNFQSKGKIIPCQRHLFSFAGNDETTVYLTNATMSVLLKSSVASAKQILETRSQPWKMTDLGVGLIDQVKEKSAKLFNCAASDIAYVQSTSSAMSLAALNLLNSGKLNKDSTVVILKDQFWSNVLPWQNACKKVGAKLIAVKNDVAVLSLLKTTNNVICALPTVLWCNGETVDVNSIGQYIKSHESSNHVLLIDCTQTLGAVPFNVKLCNPDFVCCSVYKWLLGTYPGALFYAKPHWQKFGIPLEYHLRNVEKYCGGIGDGSSFTIEFDSSNPASEFYSMELSKTGMRFEAGGNPPLFDLSILNASLDQILDWGVDNIERTLKSYISIVAKGIKTWNQIAGKNVFYTPQNIGSNIIGFNKMDDQTFTDRLMNYLKSKEIYVASRFGYLRVSPHLYNSVADLQKFVDETTKFIESDLASSKL